MRSHTYAGHVHYYDRGVRTSHRISMVPHGPDTMRLVVGSGKPVHLSVPGDKQWQQILAAQMQRTVSAKLPPRAREVTFEGQWTQHK